MLRVYYKIISKKIARYYIQIASLRSQNIRDLLVNNDKQEKWQDCKRHYHLSL